MNLLGVRHRKKTPDKVRLSQDLSTARDGIGKGVGEGCVGLLMLLLPGSGFYFSDWHWRGASWSATTMPATVEVVELFWVFSRVNYKGGP